MAEAVQRALDNLRFDRMVKAFCIISPENEIYQSTLDPQIEAMVKQTVSLYQGKISQLTVNTEQGLVVISKIANDWLLAVLFPTNLSLGIAVVKTKATLLALRELELNILKTIPAVAPAPEQPTPPETTQPSPEVAPETTPEPIPEAAPETPPEPSSEPPPAPPPATPTEPVAPPASEPTPTTPPSPASPPAPIPSDDRITLSFIPHGGEGLLSALDKGSPVGSQLNDKFGPYARDVLFLVDGKRDVKAIAFLLGLPEYAIVEVLEFALSHKILSKSVSA